MNGIVNVYKEAGYSSFAAVTRLRRILNIKKAGHTGTLDPAAEGVLPICIGRATKLCSFLTDGYKTYEAVMLLGVCTDTLDTEGQVLWTCPVECTKEQIKLCAASFVGGYDQTPPMYSALKSGGKRLYELARAGVTVERAPRRIEIKELKILSIDLPRVTFSVTCSKGTYVRSLCDDMGKALKCGACMEKLIRTRSGMFSAEEAHTLSEIQELAESGRIREIIIPPDEVLAGHPKISCLAEFDKTVKNGGKLPIDACAGLEEEPESGALFRMYGSGGEFIGIYRYSASERVLRPEKILFGADESGR